MIRFILVCIVVIAYLVLTIPVLLVEWIIGKFSPMTKDISSLRMVQAIFNSSCGSQRQSHRHRRRKRSKGSGCSLCSKPPELFRHPAHLQPLSDPHRLCCKKEMEHYPLLSNWMRNLYCLFLDREDIKQGLKTILQAADYVKSGISVCIFPEGTRNKNADETEMLPFHDAASRSQPEPKARSFLLRSATLPISGSQFPEDDTYTRSDRIWQAYHPSELDRDTQRRLGSYTQDIIKEMLIKNKELV